MTGRSASTILVICLAWWLTACRSHTSIPQTSPPVKETIGFIEGKVTIGPLWPGPVRFGKPEPEPPAELFASHKIVILSEDRSSRILEVPIDSHGNYRAEVAPGTYFLDFAPRDIGMKGSNPPKQIIVEAGKATHQDIDIDTGMR